MNGGSKTILKAFAAILTRPYACHADIVITTQKPKLVIFLYFCKEQIKI